MNQDASIPWGVDANKVLRSAADVPRGLACDCYCANCKSPLEACQGPIVRPYFRHTREACAGAGETALHLFAKETIREKPGDFALPGGIALGDIASVDLEPWLGDLRPDAVIAYAREPVAIEVWVTHETPAEKIAKYTICAVELDLRAYYGATVYDDAEWREIILHNAPRYWLRQPLCITDHEAAMQVEAALLAPPERLAVRPSTVSRSFIWADDSTPGERRQVISYSDWRGATFKPVS